MSEKNLSVSQLNLFFNTHCQIYNSINQIYFLPDFSSKAIHMPYLEKIQKLNPGNPEILAIERKDMQNMVVNKFNKQYDASVLLKILDTICEEKGLPKTGLSLITLPNVQWLLKVTNDINPEDAYKVFAEKISLSDTIERNINPKYLVHIYVLIMFIYGRLVDVFLKEKPKNRRRGHLNSHHWKKAVLKLRDSKDQVTRKIRP